MSLWHNLQRLLGLYRPNNQLSLEMDQNLILSLERLAQREQRPETELAAELLSMALAQRREAETNLRHWEALSPREQQVTALICLGYTNPQIAVQADALPADGQDPRAQRAVQVRSAQQDRAAPSAGRLGLQRLARPGFIAHIQGPPWANPPSLAHPPG